MDTKHPEPILKTCQNQEWHILTNRRLFENAFGNSSKEQVSAVLAKTSLKPSSKNVYLHGETGVGKQN